MNDCVMECKRSFLECDAQGALMVYICKLVSIQGQDIQGFECGTC